jgi:hypothetical protein
MNDTRQRPGDIYMPEFDVYGDAFFDVSIINVCAPSHVKKSAKGQLEGSKIRLQRNQGNMLVRRCLGL